VTENFYGDHSIFTVLLFLLGSGRLVGLALMGVACVRDESCFTPRPAPLAMPCHDDLGPRPSSWTLTALPTVHLDGRNSVQGHDYPRYVKGFRRGWQIARAGWCIPISSAATRLCRRIGVLLRDAVDRGQDVDPRTGARATIRKMIIGTLAGCRRPLGDDPAVLGVFDFRFKPAGT